MILAVDSVRGWSGALSGCTAAMAVLLTLVAFLGHALTRVPLHTLQLVVGTLLLLFGLRWLRKTILRSAGRIPLHDEEAVFARNVALAPVMSRTVDWDLIAQQYDQLVKYATALRLGIADTEDILRRFNRTNVQHPVYRALSELGKATKTIFLCRYLHSMELRREIHEGLNASAASTTAARKLAAKVGPP